MSEIRLESPKPDVRRRRSGWKPDVRHRRSGWNLRSLTSDITCFYALIIYLFIILGLPSAFAIVSVVVVIPCSKYHSLPQIETEAGIPNAVPGLFRDCSGTVPGIVVGVCRPAGRRCCCRPAGLLLWLLLSLLLLFLFLFLLLLYQWIMAEGAPPP